MNRRDALELYEYVLNAMMVDYKVSVSIASEVARDAVINAGAAPSLVREIRYQAKIR